MASRDENWLNLLHYENGKSVVNDSSFFLTPNGRTNPKEELDALIKEYLEPSLTNEEDITCRFPARVEFIKTYFDLPKRNKDIACEEYLEFRRKVTAQDIFLVFTAESNTSPSSMMGHLFLKFSGPLDNVTREHAFSFFATFEEKYSFVTYSKILINKIDGYYILSPYNQKITEYTKDEQRPLWEFKLNLSDTEKEKLLKHLWELKEKQITYNFISHNCGNATINVLKVAKPDIIKKETKFWTTPIEFVNKIINDNQIKEINLIPSADYQKKIDSFQTIKDITDIPPSSKLSLGFQHNIDNYLILSFRPVYLDLSDPNNLYYDDLETKLFSLELKYNTEEDKLLIDKVDILKLTSIIDFSVNSALSKHFKLSLENNFNEKGTHLKPTIEFGLGLGIALTKKIRIYILPKAGYRYNKIHNIYLNPELGLILTPIERLKILAYFENYLDIKESNRGYDKKLASTFAYQLNKNYSLELNINRYFNTTEKDINEIGMKASISF